MLQPRRTLFPIVAGTVSVILGLIVLGVAVTLLFALFGFAIHLVWFGIKLAIIVALITLGVRLLTRHR